MTNLEWLRSLTAEQLNDWLFGKSVVIRMDGLNKVYDDLYPRLWDIKQITILPELVVGNWLNKERGEHGELPR